MSFLETMMSRRRARIAKEYGTLSPADLERLACAGRPLRDFGVALRDRVDVAVIAEVKKASPSAGPIAPECEASKQAVHYQHGGAAAISVLTEPDSFGGSFTDLSDVADAVDIPVLCKDFVVDPVQLFVARGHGADAILLMVSVLGHMTRDYVAHAITLGLTPIVEVITLDELYMAAGAGAEIIAVNNRNLHTLEVNAEAVSEILDEARRLDVMLISASGVKERSDVRRAAKAGADAVLVGESLMRSPFPEEMVEGLTGVAREVSVA